MRSLPMLAIVMSHWWCHEIAFGLNRNSSPEKFVNVFLKRT